jgi:competence protein ComGC
MRRTLLAGLCLVFALGGCKAKEALDKVAISKDLSKNGTVDLMKKVADDQYTAPADGKLTDGQVQMYLKVREHEKQIAQVAKQEAQQHADAAKKAGEKSLAGMMEGFKTIGSVADLVTADIRAAKDLGYNTQEYLWVKGQILAVSSAAMAEKMTEAGNAAFEQMVQQTKKSYDEATDEQTKKMYKETLDALDKQKQEMAASKEKEDPALAYNKQLVSKYEDALNAFMQELAKYEEKKPETKP